ncbi:SET domain-containing protein-lysine N-methyltransferase [Niveispirillum irakense]|uniref:SET domain-containing protein-lysine N-methyltransferase n=1 Tax=Niveispirillum irakense TaxID=34011 RepID=UPI00048FF2C2|nr:SET domain-containing protein-lysine N-methyltransferase [Niveispirillum irakense]
MLLSQARRAAPIDTSPATADRSVARPLYPMGFVLGAGYPTDADCIVHRQDAGKGLGVYARRAFQRGQLICRISGSITHEVMQHTLQISPGVHLYDPFFTGYLLHACDPNCFLDMQRFELWALKDIAPAEAMTMDYASTEDVLFKQFRCLCGSANCRDWITGRREAPQRPASE